MKNLDVVFKSLLFLHLIIRISWLPGVVFVRTQRGKVLYQKHQPVLFPCFCKQILTKPLWATNICLPHKCIIGRPFGGLDVCLFASFKKLVWLLNNSGLLVSNSRLLWDYLLFSFLWGGLVQASYFVWDFEVLESVVGLVRIRIILMEMWFQESDTLEIAAWESNFIFPPSLVWLFPGAARECCWTEMNWAFSLTKNVLMSDPAEGMQVKSSSNLLFRTCHTKHTGLFEACCRREVLLEVRIPGASETILESLIRFSLSRILNFIFLALQGT